MVLASPTSSKACYSSLALMPAGCVSTSLTSSFITQALQQATHEQLWKSTSKKSKSFQQESLHQSQDRSFGSEGQLTQEVYRSTSSKGGRARKQKWRKDWKQKASILATTASSFYKVKSNRSLKWNRNLVIAISLDSWNTSRRSLAQHSTLNASRSVPENMQLQKNRNTKKGSWCDWLKINCAAWARPRMRQSAMLKKKRRSSKHKIFTIKYSLPLLARKLAGWNNWQANWKR